MQGCNDVFQALVDDLDRTHILSKPSKEEDLFVYLEIHIHALSAVNVHEESQVQRLVYYINKRLMRMERKYSKLEKLDFCLLIASRKLRPYFQGSTN